MVAKWIVCTAVLASSGTIAQTLGTNVVARVTERVNAGDCVGAVTILKTGLADNTPGTALLAGTMYERGICLKQNWDSAVGNYILAHERGEPAAAYRLAAGYAAPLGGPDPAAALWWIGQSNAKNLQQPCHVPESEQSDPDRFVAALQKWTPARIAECNYVAGVFATVVSDVLLSRELVWTHKEGQMVLRFKPALGEIDVWATTTGGVFSNALPAGQEASRRAARSTGLESSIKNIADSALVRYPKPPGLDPVSIQMIGFTVGRNR
jgi:hypothetical protein